MRVTFLDGQTVDGANRPATSFPEATSNWGASITGMSFGEETILEAYDEVGIFEFTNIPHPLSVYPEIDAAMENSDAYDGIEYYNGEAVYYWGVIRTDKYDYIIYDRDNGKKGVVSIGNKMTGRSYGDAS